MSRSKTVEEVREEFLNRIRAISSDWIKHYNLSHSDRDQKNQPMTIEDVCDGVAFSILSSIDGVSSSLPSFDLVVRPHPDNKQFNIDNDENYYQDGVVINSDCYLHDQYYHIENQDGTKSAR